MTWSQMTLFASAARLARLSDIQVELSVAHNPYRKDAAKFPRSIRQAIGAERRGRDGAPVGVSVKQLESFLGKMKVVRMPLDELKAKALPRTRGTFKR